MAGNQEFNRYFCATCKRYVDPAQFYYWGLKPAIISILLCPLALFWLPCAFQKLKTKIWFCPQCSKEVKKSVSYREDMAIHFGLSV